MRRPLLEAEDVVVLCQTAELKLHACKLAISVARVKQRYWLGVHAKEMAPT